MKILRIISMGILAAGILLTTSCDPNKELYEMLDNDKKPYNESIKYTLVDTDYNLFDGDIKDYKAFNDSLPAMEYVPSVLALRFITLSEKSSAMVTYNHLLLNPIWWDAGFGYVLTPSDYAYIGVDNAFTVSNPASNSLPDFLLKQFPGAQEGYEIGIIYNFIADGEITLNLDVYKFNGNYWELIETTENIPYVGYELTTEDYENFGGSIAQHNNFSQTNDPDLYIPIFLKNKFPYDPINSERVVKYKYFSGGQNRDVIDLYKFNGLQWLKESIIEERSEQYVFGEIGWAFDPTVTFQMVKDDYMHLAVIDPIPHPVYIDFGYYFGASAFYSNFDIRLIGRRLNKDDDGNYRDEALGEIYESEGSDAAMEEMLRRIVEEGLIELLQYKFSDAVPQVGGIDVHYIVQFETFADNWVRGYPEAEYRCVEAGSPPQFELIEGPRVRE